MRDWISVLLFCCGLTVGVGAVVEKAEDAPRPLSPEESVRRMVLPEGLRIELVASEPVVEEPSGVAWDEWGRMFVCELHGYNVEGHLDTEALNQTGELDTTVRRVRWEFMDGEIAQEAAKRQSGVVKLLEDSDGDGVMDEAVVWADDLPPCYGIVAANGGIIVACAPHVMFFADRDGDGVPEVRETLFTGFEVETLERAINNPRWGLDGWIYVGSGGGGGEDHGAVFGWGSEVGEFGFPDAGGRECDRAGERECGDVRDDDERDRRPVSVERWIGGELRAAVAVPLPGEEPARGDAAGDARCVELQPGLADQRAAPVAGAAAERPGVDQVLWGAGDGQ